MRSIFEKSGDKGVLKFEGELTLTYASEMRAALIKALIDADHVGIDFGSVTEADLSCLQLLCSAHRTSLKLNKHLIFVGSLPRQLIETVNAAGYSRSSGCTRDHEHSCLWVAQSGSDP